MSAYMKSASTVHEGKENVVIVLGNMWKKGRFHMVRFYLRFRSCDIALAENRLFWYDYEVFGAASTANLLSLRRKGRSNKIVPRSTPTLSILSKPW